MIKAETGMVNRRTNVFVARTKHMIGGRARDRPRP